MSEREALHSVSMVDLVSTAEARRILGVSKPTLCRWAASGRLPGIKVGDGSNGFYVFDRADVLALDRRRREALAALEEQSA